jgi:uncharacterized OB-fold protein
MPLDLEVVAHSGDRPLPTPNPFSKPFWEAAKRHELTLQKCDRCGTVRYYPRPRCPECQSPDTTWTVMSGRGSVYSFTIVHRPLARWFKDHMPVVVAIIDLDEGVRMMSNVVECEPDDVHVGMRVAVTWDDVDEEITLPKFVPAP